MSTIDTATATRRSSLTRRADAGTVASYLREGSSRIRTKATPARGQARHDVRPVRSRRPSPAPSA